MLTFGFVLMFSNTYRSDTPKYAASSALLSHTFSRGVTLPKFFVRDMAI
jgi:hypothetical protein